MSLSSVKGSVVAVGLAGLPGFARRSALRLRLCAMVGRSLMLASLLALLTGGAAAAAAMAEAPGLQARTFAPAALVSAPKLIDLGTGVAPLAAPAVVSGRLEVPVAGGVINVLSTGQTTKSTPSAPATDPNATFEPAAISSTGLVVGFAQRSGSANLIPAYWNSATSASFTEISLAGLTVNGQPVTSGRLLGLDAAGEAVGEVQDASAAVAADFAGLFVPASGGVPAGSPQVVASLYGTALYSLSAISSGYELGANPVGCGCEILIDRSTATAVTTSLRGGEQQGVEMAADGALVGPAGSGATTDLRTASGSEVVLAPLSGDAASVAESINSSHVTVGASVSAASVYTAVLWDASGDPTALSSELPANTGWTLQIPRGIDDSGNIVGTGTYEGQTHGFLLQVAVRVPPVVNSTGDAPASDPTSGSCDTGSTVANAQGVQIPQCTLRAAIQAVNALGNQTAITFVIPSTSTPTISPASALPAITAAGTVVDGTTEDGGLVTIDGTGLAGKGDCLSVAASQVTVQGMDLINCETGVELQAPGADKVQGDLIGVKPDGTTPVSGGEGVQVDAGSSGNLIGGDQRSLGNVISDQGDGVVLLGPSNQVEGNLLGTDRDGTGFIPDQIAVAVSGTGNTIGAKTSSPGTAPGNVMVAGSPTRTFDFDVLLTGGSNTVVGNSIGTDATGDNVYAPKSGLTAASDILISAPGNQIGGAGGLGNVIAGARNAQILIDGEYANAARLAGNRIGAGNNGQVLGNNASTGVVVAGANGSVIGAAGAGNTITGQKYGVVISNDSQQISFSVAETVDGVTTYQYYTVNGTDTPAKDTAATVKHNVIGPLPGGAAAPETPQEIGVLDDRGDDDAIGPSNVISWNQKGIELHGTKKVGIVGNLIGTDAGGLDALPNGIGVYLDKTDETQLGVAGEPDTISGNALGVHVDGTRTLIQAELIGPNSRGNAALKAYSGKLPATLEDRGDTHGGVDTDPDDRWTVIGGPDRGDEVTIAGVDGTGVYASGSIALIDDRIGVGRNGRTVLANKGDGVDVLNADPAVIFDSVIAHDREAGVEEAIGRHAANILETRIYDNAKGGIVIRGLSAPTAPKLSSAINTGGGTSINLDFTIPSGDTGIVQVFATPSCEARGAGKKLIDKFRDLAAGPHYNASVLADTTEPVGTAITATLTVGSGGKLSKELEDGLHLEDGATSQFSDCQTVAPSK